MALLAAVGVADVRVLGGYHGGAPAELDGIHVFVATAPGSRSGSSWFTEMTWGEGHRAAGR